MWPLSIPQKIILTIGATIFIACCLFPPWVYTYKEEAIYSEESAGYSLIFNPPPKERYSSVAGGVKLDAARLVLQISMISIATGVGFVLTYKKS
jgi:hypothetical protein